MNGFGKLVASRVTPAPMKKPRAEHHGKDFARSEGVGIAACSSDLTLRRD